MFDLQLRRDENLPPLAWLAHLAKSTLYVYCGRDVDNFENKVFEGAWSGSFDEASFEQARTVLGSGLVVKGETILFVTPSHTLEGILVYKQESGLYISNSLAFLFEAADIVPEFDRNFGRKMASVAKGIDKYEKHILSTLKGEIYRFTYHNFCVNSSGHISYIPKSDALQAADFRSYVKEVEKDVSLVIENAASSSRQRQFSPITTCSSGYDSPTAAVFAAKFGCRDALTLKNARGGADDSGAEVGETIDLQVQEFERISSISSNGFPEAEFLATGMGGEDFVYSVFEPVLAGKVLFTGFHGDKIWDKYTLPQPGIVRGDISGSSLGDYRLRVGFIHLPLPFIGANDHKTVYDISNNEEMTPYSVVGKYDRPIPRRIVEGAGVPRSLFGQTKKAASILFRGKGTALSERFRDKVQTEEKRYFAQNKQSFLRYKALRLEYFVRWYLARILNKASQIVPLLRPLFTPLVKWLSDDLKTYEHNDPRAFFYMTTAVNLLRNRYTLKQ